MFDLGLERTGWIGTTTPLGRNSFLSPTFLCLKNPRWRPNISRRKSERSLAINTPALQASDNLVFTDHKRRSHKWNRKKMEKLPTPIPSCLYDSAFDSDFGFSLGRKHSYNSAYDSDHIPSESQPSLKPRITEFTSFNPYFTAPYKTNKLSCDRALTNYIQIQLETNIIIT